MRRIALAFALAACASPAFAVQDRYGPPRTEAPFGARLTLAPAGPLLDWQGKTPPAQANGAPGAVQRPEPLAPWAQRQAPPQSQARPAAQVAAPAATAQARLLPPPANAPQPYAARAAVNTPVANAQAPGGALPRFYSVSRQYGAQPDPIPVAAAPRGPALTLSEIPASENLGRTQAPLDDGRGNQAVATPVTRENAASNRVSRFGL